MSSTILTNWTVYYADDAAAGAGMKQIKWTGGGGPESNTNTVNELYSALTDLFSDAAQNDADDTIPMRAVTPSVYEIGSFDVGDLEPWFIDPGSIEHLTGGSLQTVNWERDIGLGTGDSGIVMVQCSSSGFNIVAGDIGDTCTHSSGDDGWILHVDTTNYRLWIRPTDNTTSNDFDTASGTITMTTSSNTATQTAVAVTGERLWANIYTLGTIVDDTRLYVAQNFTTFTNFWGDGHLDRLFLINDGFVSGLIDEGFLTVYARQYGKLYDQYEIDVSSGGRNPVPLATSDDANNDSGYRTLTISSGTGTWTVGNYIYYDNAGSYTWATTTKKGVITSGGSGTTPTLEYYLIGDLTDFSDTDEVTEYDPVTEANGDANGDVNGAPSATGPNTGTPATITVTFAGTSQDLNNGNGSRPYSVTIDCQQVALTTVYERLKYLTRRGSTGDIDDGSQSVVGEQYQAIGDLYLPYDNGSTDNPFTEGETITGPSSFTGTLTSKHDQGTNEGFIIMRNCRGTTPSDNDTLTGGASGHTASVDEDSGADPVAEIAQTKSAPFGTFAGGKFFGARGVWITDYAAADATNFELIDSEGDSQVPPTTVAITVSGVVSGDRVSVFRTTGDNYTVDKEMYTAASSNTTGNSSFVISESIASDTPSTGSIRVVDTSDTSSTRETRYTYTSWSGSTFSGLSPVLDRTYTQTSDRAYVPFVDTTATGTSVSASVTYASDRWVTTKVRIKGIVPFIVKGQVTTAGYSVTAIRTTDSIAS